MDREGLIRQTLHICRREARRWSHTPLDQEDLAADGAVGLTKAANRYDPERGVPFQSFALPYVRGAIMDTVRARARRESMRDGTYAVQVSLESVLPGRDDDYVREIADPRSQTEDIAERLDALRVVATLPAKERLVLLRQVEGESAEDIGRDLGVSVHRVYQLAHNGVTRLRRRAA